MQNHVTNDEGKEKGREGVKEEVVFINCLTQSLKMGTSKLTHALLYFTLLCAKRKFQFNPGERRGGMANARQLAKISSFDLCA